MNTKELREVTITHNISNPQEVKILYERKWIALDWGRKGPDLSAYPHPKAQSQMRLFHEMREKGAAVVAAYRGATKNPSIRVIGYVKPAEPGSPWERLSLDGKDGLLCLALTQIQEFDASVCFLGNLAPRQCTMQPCGMRAKGRLAALVFEKNIPREVGSLHYHDVEWLVTNFLIMSGKCGSVWSGGRSHAEIDHAGLAADGEELLAQTTISERLEKKKAGRLLELKKAGRKLLFFGPEIARTQCPQGVEYHAIEDVFREMDKTTAGRWLIDSMLNPRRLENGVEENTPTQ